ncbi:MAG: DUF1460 domain-containing protein [Deltaproteobacteria bacterium]|nr:DUF1460 domain-containing protein [Deltaproteobacteria bacterium]
MICDPLDRTIFRDLMKILGSEAGTGRNLQELVISAGKHFLGAPYIDAPLEHRPETLVINLRAFDCFTFVENALVLAGLAWKGRTGFPAYMTALRAVRYRQGRIDGYSSRLHYFTDWINENMQRGILKDRTCELGGRRFRKRIDHMTMNRQHYSALQEEANYREMKETERRLSRRVRHEIPGNALNAAESGIAGGDLIAVLTDQDGLDCLHAGLAIRTGKHLHLLHASRKAGSVVISPETLHAYLAADRRRSGILVARIISF